MRSAGTMPPFWETNMNQRRLYLSDNGDSWWLCRTDTGRVFVLHEPNAPSGGTASEIGIRTFLSAGAGPEQQALLRLIGGLANAEL
jgi:hypothetical protein